MDPHWLVLGTHETNPTYFRNAPSPEPGILISRISRIWTLISSKTLNHWGQNGAVDILGGNVDSSTFYKYQTSSLVEHGLLLWMCLQHVDAAPRGL